MKKLGKKELLFCRMYNSCRNGREAAYRAGYTLYPELHARSLLSREEIQKELSRLAKLSENGADEVRAGLRRVAFGSSADAVKLIFDEEITAEKIEELDLFNISEIKRPKAGGVEVKFFDRIKALEKLGEFQGAGKADSAQPFYEALERSAKSIGGGEDGI